MATLNKSEADAAIFQHRCPYCKECTHGNATFKPMQIEEHDCYQDIICGSCGTKWAEHYKKTGIYNIKGSKEPITITPD